jgi:hypothetical protein
MVRRRRIGDEALAPSGHGAGTIELGRRRGEVVRRSTGVRVPFYRVRRGRGGREWRAAAVIGAFMAAVTRVMGGELRLIEVGGVKGGDRCSSMAWKKGASMAQRRRERRRRRYRLSEGGRKGKRGHGLPGCSRPKRLDGPTGHWANWAESLRKFLFE